MVATDTGGGTCGTGQLLVFAATLFSIDPPLDLGFMSRQPSERSPLLPASGRNSWFADRLARSSSFLSFSHAHHEDADEELQEELAAEGAGVRAYTQSECIQLSIYNRAVPQEPRCNRLPEHRLLT